MTKENTEVFHSPGHPDFDLVISLQISKANKPLMEKRCSKQAANKLKQSS